MSRPVQQTAIVSITRLAAIGAALLMLTVLTVSRSQAAFTSSAANSANSFSTGNVTITDDDAGTALFAATTMSPGSPIINCIALTYTGTVLPATVKLYGTTTGALDTYLDTTVEVGTGGTFGDCTGFSATSTIYTGTLANFDATLTDYASGVTIWAPATNPSTVTLRFTVDVQDNNLAQGLSSTAEFTFEAQD